MPISIICPNSALSRTASSSISKAHFFINNLPPLHFWSSCSLLTFVSSQTSECLTSTSKSHLINWLCHLDGILLFSHNINHSNFLSNVFISYLIYFSTSTHPSQHSSYCYSYFLYVLFLVYHSLKPQFS